MHNNLITTCQARPTQPKIAFMTVLCFGDISDRNVKVSGSLSYLTRLMSFTDSQSRARLLLLLLPELNGDCFSFSDKRRVSVIF
ncbi:hypothetical protein TorRG33x02_306840 [Trema orientale]|uniref:Uncharacterized protein n=1 Tax=Trema orientale TaxID=63057 RepID=A0A2P5BVZ3_TREOI|nr:hypothetical protein TorRG33x02_306840 [Trema orientale]